MIFNIDLWSKFIPFFVFSIFKKKKIIEYDCCSVMSNFVFVVFWGGYSDDALSNQNKASNDEIFHENDLDKSGRGLIVVLFRHFLEGMKKTTKDLRIASVPTNRALPECKSRLTDVPTCSVNAFVVWIIAKWSPVPVNIPLQPHFTRSRVMQLQHTGELGVHTAWDMHKNVWLARTHESGWLTGHTHSLQLVPCLACVQWKFEQTPCSRVPLKEADSRLIRSKILWRWYISTNITFLDINHCLIFNQKPCCLFFKTQRFGAGFCLRLQVKPTLALSIGSNWVGFTWRQRQNPVSETLCFEKQTTRFLDKYKKMDNVQKHNICDSRLVGQQISCRLRNKKDHYHDHGSAL
jgi:hypothetical protein